MSKNFFTDAARSFQAALLPSGNLSDVFAYRMLKVQTVMDTASPPEGVGGVGGSSSPPPSCVEGGVTGFTTSLGPQDMRTIAAGRSAIRKSFRKFMAYSALQDLRGLPPSCDQPAAGPVAEPRTAKSVTWPSFMPVQ